MQISVKHCVAVILLILLPLSAIAAEEWYSAEMPVADEGNEARNTALGQLLLQVMQRVSGRLDIGEAPGAQAVIAAAPSLVQQYRYRSDEQDGQMLRYLWARFDPSAVDRRMREQQLPVWSRRPRVLMWVAMQQGNERSLLNFDNDTRAREAVLAQAKLRGMPLQLPLMDLQDQAAMSTADLWSMFADGIQKASERYPYDAILIGRLRSTGRDQWAGDWSLWDEAGIHPFDARPGELGEALADAVTKTIDLHASRFVPAVSAGGGSVVTVQFMGVTELASYGRLLAYLENLDSVARVSLRSVDNDSYTFEFALRDSVQSLVDALGDAPNLAAEIGPLEQVPSATGETAAAAKPPATRADYYYRLLN